MRDIPLCAAERLRDNDAHGYVVWTSPSGVTTTIVDSQGALGAIAGLERGFDADAAGLALYALILTLRARRGYPSDAMRSAVIQAAETLRSVIHPQYAPILDQALTLTDSALVNGDDAVEALTAFTANTIARLDRAAERCGRRAAALLDENDRLLTTGAGAALRWMLQIAIEQGTAPRIVDADHRDEATICVIAGVCVSTSGDVIGLLPDEIETIAAARRHGLPVYVLAPGGPVAGALPGDRLSAHLVSAIVTDRGIYRPERIAAYQELSP
ncbi:hypothetical protein [Roseiflexus sp.]|uniref:hypothetical protein n=1 Tax=Roseiflexus sp. TaxID=2562120 RepID=UPI00398ACA38